MPIRSRYTSRRTKIDRHVLWGQTTEDLSQLVWVEQVAGPNQSLAAHRAANAATFNYEFRPTFRAALAGNTYSGFGINVDRVTGIVSFTAAAPPAVTRPNFIVELLITQNEGGLAVDEPLPFRFHVHRSVTNLRITPDRYRVHADFLSETYGRKYALRGLFDDNVVGDISEQFNVTWSCATPSSNVNGCEIKVVDAPGTIHQVTASYLHTTGQPPLTANATLEILPAWALEANPPIITLVDGHPDTWAGTIRPESVPNVLIMGAGYMAGDAASFDGVTNKIVHDLKRDSLTSPYDRLATSMNYWRLMPPANIRGGKRIRCEVYTQDAGANMKALPMPISKRFRAGGAPQWSLHTLLYHIGPPIPAETSGATEKNAAVLKAEWTAALPAALVPNVSDEVIAAWKQLGTRQFVDYEDQFPVIMFGEPPAATDDSNTPLLVSEDGDEEDLRDYCASAISSNNVSIDGPNPLGRRLGRLWRDDSLTRAFDNRSLMVVISATPAGRATRGSFIRMTVNDSIRSIPVQPAAGGVKSLTTNFTATPPSTVSRDVWRTISHELGHSFGLGDEYVERPFASNEVETGLAHHGNLMSSAIRPASPGSINPADIKWNWLRIRKAAVMEGPAMFLAGVSDIDVLLKEEDANRFAINDTLMLRTRRRHAALTGALNTVAGETTQQSPALKLKAKAPGQVMVAGNPVPGIVLKLEWTGVTAALAAPFAKGSIVFLPQAVKTGTIPPYGPFKKLIAPSVEKYIKTNNKPLSPDPPDVNAEVAANGLNHTAPSETYPLLFSFKNTSRILGLYQGGAYHALGIYRPAGECMMRHSHDSHEFCQACRYIIVDMIDPRQHWFIDRDYERYYPD